MPESAQPSTAGTTARRRKISTLLCLLGLFLTGLGAKLWLINTYGTSLPFWDQWEEARNVYSPYFEGKLKFSNLFEAHNEHRIFLTRIYDLALLTLNNQWDNRLEAVVNAVVHVTTLVGFGWLMIQQIGQRFAGLIVLPIAAALALPFGWENAMSGFHSQHYFMVVLALPTLWLLGTQKPWSWQWWIGAGTAFAGLFTVGAGFIAALAVCGLVFLKFLLDRSSWKSNWPTFVLGLIVFLIGFAMRSEVPHHESLKARSAMDFLISLGKYLSWPWIVLPPFAAFNLLPLVLLTWFYIRKPIVRTRGVEIIMLVGLWTGLQCMAAAYARGAHGAHPQWRYMDTTSFLMIVNALSLLSLWNYRREVPLVRFFPAVNVLWILACVFGLALLSYQALRSDIPSRASLHRLQLVTMRGYVATKDERFFEVRKEYLARFEGDPNKPQNHADVLIQYLNLPYMRSLLPACVRLPLPMQPAEAIGFGSNDSAAPQFPGEVWWSSGGNSPQVKARSFESLPMAKPQLPFLQFRVAGDLRGPGSSLAIIDLSNGKRTEIKPVKYSNESWQNFLIRSPHGDFKIVAKDENAKGWFAFQAPREIGGLSCIAEWLTASGWALFVAGAFFMAAAVVTGIERSETTDTLQG